MNRNENISSADKNNKNNGFNNIIYRAICAIGT